MLAWLGSGESSSGLFWLTCSFLGVSTWREKETERGRGRGREREKVRVGEKVAEREKLTQYMNFVGDTNIHRRTVSFSYL